VVNIFVRSSSMGMIISYIGVIVFVGLTAYDTQRLKTMALQQPDGVGEGVARNAPILVRWPSTLISSTSSSCCSESSGTGGSKYQLT